MQPLRLDSLEDGQELRCIKAREHVLATFVTRATFDVVGAVRAKIVAAFIDLLFEWVSFIVVMRRRLLTSSAARRDPLRMLQRRV